MFHCRLLKLTHCARDPAAGLYLGCLPFVTSLIPSAFQAGTSATQANLMRAAHLTPASTLTRAAKLVNMSASLRSNVCHRVGLAGGKYGYCCKGTCFCLILQLLCEAAWLATHSHIAICPTAQYVYAAHHHVSTCQSCASRSLHCCCPAVLLSHYCHLCNVVTGLACKWDYFSRQGVCSTHSTCPKDGSKCFGKSEHLLPRQSMHIWPLQGITLQKCKRKCSSFECFVQREDGL